MRCLEAMATSDAMVLEARKACSPLSMLLSGWIIVATLVGNLLVLVVVVVVVVAVAVAEAGSRSNSSSNSSSR